MQSDFGAAELCGHPCKCNKKWFEECWTCPTEPPNGENSCGFDCKCQTVWFDSGWICWRRINNAFSKDLLQRMGSDFRAEVVVLNMSGLELLYIGGCSCFSRGFIMRQLKSLYACRFRLLVGNVELPARQWYNGEQFFKEFGTYIITAVREKQYLMRESSRPHRG